VHEVTSRHFIIATAGHVDHGKSALVKALTGTDPDRLPEEKKRQITIDLGFTELNLTGPNDDRIHAGIVDVPGHEDFVRNMIAGVGSIDLALFVVATDDGWMPQSEEHLQILNYLGVRRAVIALTKSDLGLVDFVTDQIRRKLHDTRFADAPIVPTSIHNGAGIEKLTNTLATELARMEPQQDIGKPRLFVDRVFTLHGIGTIVTGTLTGGSLRRGQQIMVYPASLETRIRSVQSHGQELQIAHPGMRTAVNLPDVPLHQIKRGDVITIRDLGAPGSTLVVILERSARLHREDRAARPLKNGSSIYLHHGTSRVAARITDLETGQLEPREKTIARIKLAAPIFAFAGDRFVVRNPSERHTLAGGMVLDPNNQDTTVDDKHKRSLLMARAAAPDHIGLWVRSEVALHRFVSAKMLLNQSHFSADAIADAVMRLDREKKIVVRGEIIADAQFWRNLRVQAIAVIDETHSQSPDRAGIDLNDLRSALHIQQPAIFEALLADLCDGDYIRKGSVVARISHRPALPGQLKVVEKRIREFLSKNPFDPPPRRAVEPDPQAQQVARFLVENGELIEIAPDVVLLRENFECMKSRVAEFISTNGAATVSQLRQALGSSRRVMVPLLERLDRDGVTQRLEDKRILCRIRTL
jgi:selenocysteine-specific elongation factor